MPGTTIQSRVKEIQDFESKNPCYGFHHDNDDLAKRCPDTEEPSGRGSLMTEAFLPENTHTELGAIYRKDPKDEQTKAHFLPVFVSVEACTAAPQSRTAELPLVLELAL